MDRVSSTKFQRELGRFLSSAKRDPVTITSRGRDEWVVLDAGEFNRLKQLDNHQTLYAWEMNEEQLNALANAEPSAESEALNTLLD